MPSLTPRKPFIDAVSRGIIIPELCIASGKSWLEGTFVAGRAGGGERGSGGCGR